MELTNMGESKRRGSREERVAQSQDKTSNKLKAIIKALGLPENAEFHGYLIQQTEKGEFVQTIEETPELVNRTFVKTPELAMRFERFWDANKYTKEDKGEAVVGLFGVGDELVVRRVL
jgi:hypothetical protein